MDSSLDPYDPEVLLRAIALENAELRELLVLVVGDLERLAYPELAERFLARGDAAAEAVARRQLVKRWSD